MKKLFSLLAAGLLAIISLDAQSASDSEIELKVGTFNIWSDLARQGQIKRNNTTAARGWDASKQSVAELIADLDCDILGMQEVTETCRDDLKKLVRRAGGRYQMWWVNTYPEGHRSVVGNAVFFKRRSFRFDERRILYFSPTPEVISQGWDEKKYYRAALTSVVTHRKSGRQFFFIATHGPLGKEANAQAARILVEIDQKYNNEGLPVIVLGDMNASPDKPFYGIMCSHYEDTYNNAGRKCGNVGTFNSSGEYEENFLKPERRIDHIYVRSTDKGQILVEEYAVNRDKYMISGSEHYPSDHNPVVVEILLR